MLQAASIGMSRPRFDVLVCCRTMTPPLHPPVMSFQRKLNLWLTIGILPARSAAKAGREMSFSSAPSHHIEGGMLPTKKARQLPGLFLALKGNGAKPPLPRPPPRPRLLASDRDAAPWPAQPRFP